MMRTLLAASILLALVSPASANSVNVFAVGNGVLTEFIANGDGHDIIVIGDRSARRLRTGACILVVGANIDLGTENHGTTIVPGSDRAGIHRALRRTLATLPNQGKSLHQWDVDLDAALDKYKEHCGGNL